MPLYDFRCRACGTTFEQKVKLGASAPDCIQCGAPGSHVEKLLSAPGFVLKGEGWYRDHYGLKSGSKGSGSGGGSEGGGSSSSGSGAGASSGGSDG